jgi:hypothetical protein
MLIGASSGVAVAPTLTVGSTTNFNQNSAVFNGTVNATGNRNITLVEFQYATNAYMVSPSAWFTASTNSTITQGATNTACTYNATGLANGTTYWVWFRTTNTSGFVTTSATTTFTTYSERTVTSLSSTTWTNPVPTSGTNGLAITTLISAVVVGGGGAGTTGGGAGGTVMSYNNVAVGASVTVTIGAGGAGSTGADGNLSSIGTSGASGGQSGRDYFRDGYECDGGDGNGYLGGSYSAGDNAFSVAGGGGAGLGGNGGNASGNNGGNGGPANIFGFCGGGGGGNVGTGGTRGTPNGAGVTNRGTGGAGLDYIPNGYNGGSGYASFNYWGP